MTVEPKILADPAAFSADRTVDDVFWPATILKGAKSSITIEQTIICMFDPESPASKSFHFFAVFNEELSQSDIIKHCAHAKATDFVGHQYYRGLSITVPIVGRPTKMVWYCQSNEEEFDHGTGGDCLYIKDGDPHGQLKDFHTFADGNRKEKFAVLLHENTKPHEYGYGLRIKDSNGNSQLHVDPAIRNEG